MRLLEAMCILALGTFFSLIGGILVVLFVFARAIDMATDRLTGE